MSAVELAKRLREVRGLRALSLKSAATPAGISPAYLQKLERAEVKSPSPRVLHGLAEALDIPYSQLMELAGYVLPTPDATRARPSNVLAVALSSEDLTDDEAQALNEYLAWYRHRNKGSQVDGA